VLLCDWRGRVVWKSAVGERVQLGEPIWKNVAGPSKERLEKAIGSVVTPQENQTLDVEHAGGEHFRL
jgi:hypothetical protein